MQDRLDKLIAAVCFQAKRANDVLLVSLGQRYRFAFIRTGSHEISSRGREGIILQELAPRVQLVLGVLLEELVVFIYGVVAPLDPCVILKLVFDEGSVPKILLIIKPCS